VDDKLKLYQELTEAPGVPGQEEAVREIMRRNLEPYGKTLEDNLGSIFVEKMGQAGGPRIMIAGHMDEVGFMVTRITDEGFIKFTTLGGWWEQVMLAQRVTIHTRLGVLTGVVGSKPPHLLGAEERKKPVDKKEMFIDIGANNKEEAEKAGVRPGDAIVPICPFTPLVDPKLLLAKAWDNRAGCAVSLLTLELLKGEKHPNVLYAGATVQEEVGLRGAQTSSWLVEPDIAFALDVGIAGDTPGVKTDEAMSKAGKGPAISIYDAGHVAHRGLRDYVCEVADAEGIPYQFDYITGGATDAGRIHLWNKGVPALNIAIPARYIHSAASIIHRDDLENAAKLMAAVVKKLDSAALKAIRGH